MINQTKLISSFLLLIVISIFGELSSQTYKQNNNVNVISEKMKYLDYQYLGDRLSVNQNITMNQGLRSPNGLYGLIMQTDGNLCIYKNGNEFVWCSMTNNNSKNTLVMQNDGNLVMYNQLNKPIWSSNTNNTSVFKQGKTLIMQDDGNLVLYNAYNKPVWSSRSGKL